MPVRRSGRFPRVLENQRLIGCALTAMDKASSNAKDVIDTLTLNMKPHPSGAITKKENYEVVNGAAAAAE